MTAAPEGPHGVALLVFGATILFTFVAAWLGRVHSGTSSHDGLSDEKLNRWLIGLSAGAAANSGFIVTGAVGLGYVGGLSAVLLPLGWLLGDLIYWQVFPARLNAFGQVSRATTLSDLLIFRLGRSARVLGLLCAAVILLCLGGYLSAQWLAGQKFLAGAFGVSGPVALGMFALLIIGYTSIGGFRGSVYVDSLQAVIRIIGTAIALAAIWHFASADRPAFDAGIKTAGPGFLSLLPAGGWGLAVGTIAGFAAAAIGFGLGQPHLVSRYLAGSSPAETRAAKWIFIGFVQFTWIAMTLFGMLLRGVMPGLEDPETGLSAFFSAKVHPVLTGIIIADVFATIAATSNALLVAMAQSAVHDFLPEREGARRPSLAWTCALLGLVTMGLSLMLDESVEGLTLGSIALLGSGVAPAVMIRVLGWRHSGASLVAALLSGLAAAIVWRASGLGAVLNEALIGLLTALAVNALVVRLAPPGKPDLST